MSSVVISGDTSGAITLAAPSVAGTNTITFPASTGTVLTTGSPQSGGIIQVINATYSTSTSTSGGFTDSGLTASITPKFSTSKILCIANMNGVYKNGSNSSIGFNICRNGSEIVRFADNGLSYTGNTNANQTAGGVSYVDSPATTSSTTYKVQFKNGSGSGGSVSFNDGNVSSTLVLMEIAA
jgi:hypothetical protein